MLVDDSLFVCLFARILTAVLPVAAAAAAVYVWPGVRCQRSQLGP